MVDFLSVRNSHKPSCVPKTCSCTCFAEPLKLAIAQQSCQISTVYTRPNWTRNYKMAHFQAEILPHLNYSRTSHKQSQSGGISCSISNPPSSAFVLTEMEFDLFPFPAHRSRRRRRQRQFPHFWTSTLDRILESSLFVRIRLFGSADGFGSQNGPG